MKVSVKKRNILMFFLLLPLLETSYIANNWDTIHQIIALLKYGSIAVAFILYISDKDFMTKPTKPAIFIIVYSLIVIVSSLLNGGELITAVMESLQLIATIFLGDLIIKNSLKDYISVVYPIFFLMATINFITMVLYPNGMYSRVMEGSYVWVSRNNWFLGLENAMTAYLIPALALTYINMLIKRTRFSYLTALVMSVMCMYVPIVRHKGSMLVCFLLFIMLCLLAYWKIFPSILNARTYLIFNVLFFVAIVLLSSANTGIVAIIEAFFSRNTLSVRTVIWGKVLDLIPQKLILGYGYEAAHIVSDKLKYDSAHNQYLWILYRGGIAQFLVFGKFILDSVNSLYKKRAFAVVKIISASFFVLLLMWQTESITNNVLMLFLLFVYYVGIRGDELFLGEREFDYKKVFKYRIRTKGN